LKTIILGDLHFGARGDDPYYYDRQRQFFTEQLFPYMRKNNIDTIWQLGDMFETRKTTNNSMLQNIRNDIFDYMSENDIKFYTLAGNHDLFLRHSSRIYNPANALADYDNLKFVREFETINFDGLDVDFVGWMNDDNKDRIAKKIRKSPSPLALGHFEIVGFSMHKGIESRSGHKAKFLSGYKQVFSGHFHTESTSGNIKYLGTPYETSWADFKDKKGFTVFDTETFETEYIQNHNYVFMKVDYPVESMETFDYASYEGKVVKCMVNDRDDKLDYFLDNLSKVKTKELLVIDNIDFIIDGGAEDDVEVESTLTVLLKTVDNSQMKNKAKVIKLIKEIYAESL